MVTLKALCLVPFMELGKVIYAKEAVWSFLLFLWYCVKCWVHLLWLFNNLCSLDSVGRIKTYLSYPINVGVFCVRFVLGVQRGLPFSAAEGPQRVHPSNHLHPQSRRRQDGTTKDILGQPNPDDCICSCNV